MWGFDFVQERFHNMSPGDFQSMFMKAEDSVTKEGLRVEEVTGERLGRGCFGSLDKLQERGGPRWGCC